MRKPYILLAIIFGVLLIDQCIKIYVKTHFALGEFVLPFGGEWCQIHFVENPGMAFGLQLGGPIGKLLLSLFRVIAIGFLGYYLVKILKEEMAFGFICCIALVWAGAFGNIIDSAVYGLFFSESGTHTPALLLPPGGGYAGFLHGKVVDMFYFPLWQGRLPTWLPFWGGEEAEFFRPVFNFADAAISVGVFFIVALQNKFFPPENENENEGENEDENENEKAIITDNNEEIADETAENDAPRMEERASI
ncbi:MAG: hypothetical protein RI894_1760 [Bacteroidota bacterium]|jgi:signal peptidase II